MVINNMFKKLIKFIKVSLSCAALAGAAAGAGYIWLGSGYAGEAVSKKLSEYCKSDISIKNISGNFFNKTVFSDLTMSAKAGGEKKSGVENIKADSASAKYSLLSILRNQKLIIRDFDLNNMSVNFVHLENDGMIDPAAFFNSVKKTVADMFYGHALGVSIDKINIDRLRLAFDNINKTAGGAINFTGLKIIPANDFMNTYQFESLLEMHKGGNLVIPSAALKGEIDLSQMSMKVLIEAERVKLANFNWLFKYFASEVMLEDGLMLISAVVTYSPAGGFQIFGSASAKNISLKKGAGAFKLIGDTINISFNENSLKITDSIIKAGDIAFGVNGTVTGLFTGSGMKTSVTLKSVNAGAEKYFDAIKKYSGFEGAAGHYYSTGAVDAEIRINGSGCDYGNWQHKTSFTLKNIDIISQKISLAFERLNGRIEGDSNGFKTAGPVILKTAGRWHEFNGEVKNYRYPDKIEYNFNLKQYSPSFDNGYLISDTENTDNKDEILVAFDYDETDENWGGEGRPLDASSPFAAVRANINKNQRGFFASVNAKLEKIYIDGLFGLKNALADAEIVMRNDKAVLNNLVICQPGKTLRGDIKIFPKKGALAYELDLKREDNIHDASQANKNEGYIRDLTKREDADNIKSHGPIDFSALDLNAPQNNGNLKL